MTGALFPPLPKSVPRLARPARLARGHLRLW
jgi:hypothetical protein